MTLKMLFFSGTKIIVGLVYINSTYIDLTFIQSSLTQRQRLQSKLRSSVHYHGNISNCMDSDGLWHCKSRSFRDIVQLRILGIQGKCSIFKFWGFKRNVVQHTSGNNRVYYIENAGYLDSKFKRCCNIALGMLHQQILGFRGIITLQILGIQRECYRANVCNLEGMLIFKFQRFRLSYTLQFSTIQRNAKQQILVIQRECYVSIFEGLNGMSHCTFWEIIQSFTTAP